MEQNENESMNLFFFKGQKRSYKGEEVVDLDLVVVGDLENESEHVKRRIKMQHDSTSQLFLFSNHSSFAFTSVNSGEQPVPSTRCLVNTGAKQGVIKTSSYSQHGA